MARNTAAVETQTSTIRRITQGRRRWRVLVESWRDSDICHGRLVFRDEDTVSWTGGRESAPLLHGTTTSDVLSLAHDMTDERLRRVLNSLV